MSRGTVEIRVKGEVGASLRRQVDDVVVVDEQGTTCLRLVGRDDAALHGLLALLDGLGLELLGVERADDRITRSQVRPLTPTLRTLIAADGRGSRRPPRPTTRRHGWRSDRSST